MYSYPYNGEHIYTKEHFIQKRDSVMRINILGTHDGMYMKTNSLMTDARIIEVQGKDIGSSWIMEYEV